MKDACATSEAASAHTEDKPGCWSTPEQSCAPLSCAGESISSMWTVFAPFQIKQLIETFVELKIGGGGVKGLKEET